MKPTLTFLLCLIALLPTNAQEALPTLSRVTLSNKEMWEMETIITGYRERNGAVIECIAESLRDLLIKADMEPSVASLVEILTTPCLPETPAATIKELLLPNARFIQVSQDASFALIATTVRGHTTLEIFRDTAGGLLYQRIKH